MTRKEFESIEKVQKIIKYAMLISMNRDTDIFVKYYPHTQSVEVYGYSHGWIKNPDCDIRNMMDTLYLREDTEELNRVERILRRMWQENLSWEQAEAKEAQS